MNEFLYAFAVIVIVTSVNIHAKWVHELDPETGILKESIVLKVYPNERRPSLHNAITVTDYLNKFDLKIKKIRNGCFRPSINDWKVVSTIYIRPKFIEGPEGNKVLNPRWSNIIDFKCRQKDPDFNIWEATYQHETIHYKRRDIFLNNFWKELKAALKIHCSISRKEARNYIEGILKMFFLEVRKIDTEVQPRAHEEKWIKDQYTSKSGLKCPDMGFLKATFPKANVAVKNKIINVSIGGDSFVGLNRGNLTILFSKKTGIKYFFKYGSLLAKESPVNGLVQRTEFNVQDKAKHSVWLKGNKIFAKAWADDNGNIGKKIILSSKEMSKPEDPLITIIDTGYEDFDHDGHGTFVQSIVQEVSKIQSSRILSIKTTTNLDNSLLKALDSAKGLVLNISIGQRKYGENPASETYIDRVCSKIKRISKKMLVIIGAGNDGALLDKAPFYPAACPRGEKDNVLVVGSYDQLNKTNADFGRHTGNWSPKYLHIMVAGNLFEGFFPGKVKKTIGGTSFSAAFVSGLAAKILKAGNHYTPSQLKAMILKSCNFTPEAQEYVKGGCIIYR